MFKKLIKLLIKYMPATQMVGMLVNNTLYCIGSDFVVSKVLDFIIGNSLALTVLLFVCSEIFNFCNWHRTIIVANFINLIIANIDTQYGLNITDKQLLSIYYIISSVFIIIATYEHNNIVKNSKK